MLAAPTWKPVNSGNWVESTFGNTPANPMNDPNVPM